jgi:cell division protein FtsW (lipid II flippase)
MSFTCVAVTLCLVLVMLVFSTAANLDEKSGMIRFEGIPPATRDCAKLSPACGLSMSLRVRRWYRWARWVILICIVSLLVGTIFSFRAFNWVITVKYPDR